MHYEWHSPALDYNKKRRSAVRIDGPHWRALAVLTDDDIRSGKSRTGMHSEPSVSVKKSTQRVSREKWQR
jgi:hypothetical protein